MNDLIHPSGAVVHMAGERLSLTDMWRAAGSPENREPFNWSRKEGERFIDAVAQLHNLTVGQVMEAKKGRNGGTWAHWQIGIAYAQYLSPEFHAWCNSVVRERMEGRSVAHDDLLRRTDGISRMLAHKVTGMEKELAELVSVVRSLVITNDPRVAAVDAIPALQIAVDAKVPAAGRRPIVRAISNSLARHCEARGHIIRRDIRRTKLYPLAAVAEWKRDGGEALIRKLVAQNAPIGPLFAITGGKAP